MISKKSLQQTIFSILLFVTFFFAQQVYAATIYTNSNTGNDTTGDGTSGAPYKTFHKAYTEAEADDTINLTGTFSWDDADETGDLTVTGYTLAKDLTITGQGADETIIQAASSADTAGKRVFTIDSSATVTIQNVTIRYGYLSGSSQNGAGINNSGDLTVNQSDFA